MREIREINVGKTSKYVIYFEGNSKEKTIQYPLFYEQIGNSYYWALYNDEMTLISDFFKYINLIKTRYSINTYKSKSYSIRLLYIFCECFNADIKSLKYHDLLKLRDFLSGQSSSSNQNLINLKTKRSRNTILSFFSTYKDYLKYLNYDISSFEMIKPSDIVSISGYKQRRKYRNIVDLKYRYVEIPKYISNKQFLSIIDSIDKTYIDKELKLRDKLIITLMYEGSLRIGEVLGITFEDIKLYRTENNKVAGIIKIRNRHSDKSYQCAKTCMKIKSLSDYGKYEYQTHNVGFETTYISEITYKLLIEYIEISHGEKTNEFCSADKVDKNDELENNEYIFINKRVKTPLHISTWNKRLREIFIKNGISVNYLFKRDGLNHQFRHGFAMRCLYDLHYRIEDVQKLMRHRNISSTMKYINPTDEKIINLKESLEKERLN